MKTLLALAVAAAMLQGCDTATSSSSSGSLEIQITQDAKKTIAKAINDRGYNCPGVRSLHYRPDDAYGEQRLVYCGSDLNHMFKLTMHGNGSFSVKPASFSLFGN